MAEKKKLSDSEQLRAEEIMNELNECREDERASRNQIFTILTAIATFLTVIITVISMTEGDSLKWLPFTRKQLQLAANALSTLLLCTAMPWLANLGFLSTFRHFYIVELEVELANFSDNKGQEFLHWETVSTPLITFNYKHVLPGYSMLYNINMVITFVAILILAVVYILFIQLFAESFSIINILLTIVFWIVFFIVIFTIFVSSVKSEEIYEEAKKQAKIRLKGETDIEEVDYKEKDKKILDIKKFIFYFIYPRIVDVQKNIFILLGFLLGCVVAWYFQSFEMKWEIIARFVFVWFVFDFLIYQARYLWNDIRGISTDQVHPVKEKRGRLPMVPFGERIAIALALCVIIFRISAALVLIYLYGGEIKVMLMVCILSLWFISIFYEYVKYKQYTKIVFALVSLGYPIRLFAGLIGASPMFLEEINKYPSCMCVMLFVLIATAEFGVVFVTMTWVLEAVYLQQRGVEIGKNHYYTLLNQVQYGQQKEEYPLAYKDSISTIWNSRQIISSIFLLAALCCAWMSARDTIKHIYITFLFSFISVLVTIILGRQKKVKNTVRNSLFLIVIMSIDCFSHYYVGGVERELILYVFLCLFRVGYASIYIMFCLSNYEELISFGEKLRLGIVKGIFSLLRVGIGENAYGILMKRGKSKLL